MKKIALSLASIVPILSLSAQAQASINAAGVARDLMQMNATPLKGFVGHPDGIWSKLRNDFQMAEVNPEIVRRHEQYYSTRLPYFNRIVERSEPYMYHIAQEVQKRNMPAEIALLPIIESAFVTSAKSRVGASGLWQFMPATGLDFGLKQNNLYDGRLDVYAATDAALTYLQYLHNLFGDWSLALAAYNWGQGNVGKAIKRAQAQGKEITYENLNMPAETRNYVPKLLAVRNLIASPESFALNLAPIADQPYFGVVTLDHAIDTAAAARLAGITPSEFQRLNPGVVAPVVSTQNVQRILLPVTKIDTFRANLKKADKNTLLSWDFYQPTAGEDVAQLAANTGMTIAEIKRLNQLSSNKLRASSTILIAKNSLATPVEPIFMPNAAPTMMASAPAPAPKYTNPAPVPAPVQVAAAKPPVSQSNQWAVPASSQPSVMIMAPAKPAPQPVQVAAAPAAPSVAMPIGGLPEAISVDSVGTTDDDPLLATIQLAEARHSTPPSPSAAPNNAPIRLTPSIASPAPTQLAAAAPAPRNASGNDVKLANNRASGANIKVTYTPPASKVAPAKKAEAPAAPRARDLFYTVKPGDTLYSIAQRNNLSLDDLRKANKLSDNNIRVGQSLALIPAKSSKQGAQTAGTGKKPQKGSKLIGS
ncbi:MAG: transglycosylase SLT domain-containing protein [Neisseriaceae bacterium]|nr:transglycosylase SLT domain-containing protein [Neisseriaceae bacterium]MBP6863547.1 transglycosylase SLT domain-containing protein [Neisseriaceae bacterium]